MGAANHAGAAALAAGGRNRPEACVKRGRNRPVRMMPGPARRGRRRHRQGCRAERHGNQRGRHIAGARSWFPGLRTGSATSERKSRELSKTPENRVTPAVQNLVSQVGRPYAAVRLPARSGPAHGHRDRRPFACACQVSAEARITGTPGKMAAPCAGGGGNLFVAVRGPPSIRNSLSVQEARRCAAARHSAFSSTATGHPPGQGPGR